MTLDEIAQLRTTLTIDADEARILAAACAAAAICAEGGSTPPSEPFEQFGNPATVAMLLDGYAAMFEAASVAATAHDSLREADRKDHTLSAIRAHGTGARLAVTTTESEATR